MHKYLNNKLFVMTFIFVSGCMTITPEMIEKYYTPIPETNKKMDIPIYDQESRYIGHPYIYWHFCKQKEKQLGLVSPELSNDSLIFRFWVTNPSSKTGQAHSVLEIKNDSSGWSGQLVLMQVDIHMQKISEVITNSKTFELSPLKTDWQTVCDSLVSLKIDMLATDQQIPNYYPDGAGYLNNYPVYSFEYSTANSYRFFHYNDLDRAYNHFWQPRNIVEILKLLDAEFKWNSIGNEYFSNIF